jgi:hypothetical protein
VNQKTIAQFRVNGFTFNRTMGLGSEEFGRIGDQVGGMRGRTLKAWANIVAGVVFDVGLAIRPDNEPERHPAIIGWPAQKHEQMLLAQRLAEAATLHLPA